MDIHTQLKIVRKWLPLLVASTLAVGVAAFVLSSLQPKVYEARTTVIVGQSLSGVNPEYNQLLVSQRLSATYASIATTHDLLAGVVDELDLTTSPASLATRVFVATSSETALMTITVHDNDPKRAAAIANAVAAGLIKASPAVRGQQADLLASIDQDLAAVRADITLTQDQIQTLLAMPERTPEDESRLQTLQGRLVSLRSTAATLLSFTTNEGANLLTIVQPALAPDAPIAPRPLIDGLIAATVALLLVSGLIFVYEYLDDGIKDPEEVTATLGLPTLGQIEKMRGGADRRSFYRLAALLNPRSPTAEAYRTLRANLAFAAIDRPMRSLLVASAVPGEGKTVTAANLALVMAQSGRRVLLLDADLRRPGVHEIFNLTSTRGLTDLIRSPALDPSSLVQATEQPNLSVLTTGLLPPNPTEVLASQRTRTLVETLAGSYDMLVVDSPPVELFADAQVLSSFLDGTVLVVETRRGRRTQIRHANEALERAGATVLGVVLNRTANRDHPEYGYYYSDVEAGAGPASALGQVDLTPASPTPATKPTRRSSSSRNSARDATASRPEPR